MFHDDVIDGATCHRMQSEWRIQIHDGCCVAPKMITAIRRNQRHLRTHRIVAQDVVIWIWFQALDKVESTSTNNLQMHEIQLFTQVTDRLLFYFANSNVNETALVDVSAHLHECYLHFFEFSYKSSQLIEWCFFINYLSPGILRQLWHLQLNFLGRQLTVFVFLNFHVIRCLRFFLIFQTICCSLTARLLVVSFGFIGIMCIEQIRILVWFLILRFRCLLDLLIDQI